MQKLQSSREVIDALGGTGKFARWWGTSVKCVSAWKRRGFPPTTHYKMRSRLRDEHEIDAPPSAWNQIDESAQ